MTNSDRFKSLQEEALRLHEQWRGKLSIDSKVPVADKHALSIAYTPGVAEPCRRIADDPSLVDVYTGRWNTVAVVSDGSAVLGLGNIGARAALPVMEGKSVLFKAFGAVDAFPICIDSQEADDIVRTVKLLEPSFGGINLEDISAPTCFEVERRLIEECDIPVFHDDQHGTAVVVLAAAINACKVTGRELADLKVVMNGAGAAGIAIARMFKSVGVREIILCDTKGIIGDRREDLTPVKQEVSSWTNPEGREGDLAAAMAGANLFRRRLGKGCRHQGDGGRRWKRTPSSWPWPIPIPRSCRMTPGPPAPPSWPRAAAISPTRSTTCWVSPASSAAPWMCAPALSTRR